MLHSTEHSIVVNKLNWSFDDIKILDEISFNIEKGKFYSIIGPNGSGKTTLLKNISRALEPERETVFVLNNDLLKLTGKELAKKMACVHQNTNTDLDFQVMDIVLMGRSPYLRRFQNEGDEDISIAKKAMEMTNTLHLKSKKFNELSGGEKQRVIAARAITQDTEILLLDEPISHLDIHHQIELLDTVKTLNKRKRTTVIAVLHDLNLSAQYSDYLILMDKGKIVSYGTPEEVLTEENIKKVYNIDICLISNPATGKPHIIPISKGAR
jgi:iron complex transport system ATP-binding protein